MELVRSNPQFLVSPDGTILGHEDLGGNQRSIPTAITDQVNKALRLTTHLKGVALFPILSPATFDSNGIDAVFAQLSAQGGGTIFLPAGDYDITRPMPIKSRINYQGVAPHWANVGNFPEDGGTFVGGTRLKLAAGVRGIEYNAVDRDTPIAQAGGPNGFASDGLYCSRIYGLLFDGGLGPLKIGAKNASGAYNCTFDEIYFQQATEPWAFDLQNSQYCRIGSITARNTLTIESGGIRFGQSVNSSIVLTGDHQFFGRIFSWFNSLNGRGIRFESNNNGQLNDICGAGAGWQVNGYTADAVTLSTAACTSGSADIQLSGADLTAWQWVQVGKPVFFTGTTPNYLESGAPFFIAAKNDTAKTFQISPSSNATAGVTINQTGTFPMKVGAFPSLEIVATDQNSLITKVETGMVNCEAKGSIIPVYIYRGRLTDVDMRMQGFFPASYCEVYAKDATGSVRVQSANVIGSSNYLRLRAMQADFQLLPQMLPLRTVTAAATLDAGHDKGTLVVNSPTDVTVTIPAMLPPGFRCKIVQLGAGVVTISKGVSTLTLQSKNAYVKSSGANSVVHIERISNGAGTHFNNDDATYLLSGDLAA